jgi:hypothetical protein
MEPEGSLPQSQVLATCPYNEPDSQSPTSNVLKIHLILSSHLDLGFPSGLIPSGFPTKTLHMPLHSPIRATSPAHLILRDLSPEQYWVRSTDHKAPNYVVISTTLLPRPS